MERILVCMDARRGAWEALSRAIALAKRIEARVSVLCVLPDGAGERGDGAVEAVLARLERTLATAAAEGVRAERCSARGAFDEAVIRFVERERTSLLVLEAVGADGRIVEQEPPGLRKIRHRVSCRVEVISARKNLQLTRGD